MRGRTNPACWNWVCAISTLVVACLSFMTGSGAQTQGRVDRCTGDDGVAPDLRISDCTATIDSHTYVGKGLAFAFNNRGIAHYVRRDFERAIADYTSAIRLDPTSASSFKNRAIAYSAKQDDAHAMADYTEVIRLDPDNGYLCGCLKYLKSGGD